MSSPGRHAIIDDRRGLQESLTAGGARDGSGVGGVGLLQQAALASGSVLDGPLLPAIQGAAREPLAFTVLDVANRLTAGGAAVACRVAESTSRAIRGSLADRTGEGKKRFCCVTTRRRNLWVLSTI